MFALANALLWIGLLQAQQAPPQASSPTQENTAHADSNLGISKAKSLSKVQRIFVEAFGTDPISQQMQAMVISSLTETKRFTVTEDKSKADAILRGVATQRTAQETHAYGSGTAVGTAHGGGSGSVSGSGGSFSGSVHSGFAAARSAIQDSSVNTETIDNAHAAVRLVNTDGDVIWTTTQESDGAKFKGASADVADKIARQLTRDAEKADQIVSGQTPSK
jgi:hypothetical protein